MGPVYHGPMQTHLRRSGGDPWGCGLGGGTSASDGAGNAAATSSVLSAAVRAVRERGASSQSGEIESPMTKDKFLLTESQNRK
jgi:hypothetical protein